MKKLLLVAAIGVAGLMSANQPNSENNALIQKENLKAWFVVYTSCGVSAMTLQDWSDEQGEAWADLVEDIYCNPNYNLNLDDGIDWNGL